MPKPEDPDTTAIFSEMSVAELLEASKRGKRTAGEIPSVHADPSHQKLFFDLSQRMAVKNVTTRRHIVPENFVGSCRHSWSRSYGSFSERVFIFIPF